MSTLWRTEVKSAVQKVVDPAYYTVDDKRFANKADAERYAVFKPSRDSIDDVMRYVQSDWIACKWPDSDARSMTFDFLDGMYKRIREFEEYVCPNT